jgi:hypothetical protein
MKNSKNNMPKAKKEGLHRSNSFSLVISESEDMSLDEEKEDK